MNAGSGWIAAIDFGTAYSKAAVAPVGAFRSGRARPLPLARGLGARNPFQVVSALFVDRDRVYFGPHALVRSDEQSEARREALQSFKLLLGSPDLSRTLEQLAAPAVDPHRRFRLRDLIVLYLAYVLRLMGETIEADPVVDASPDDTLIRYALPAWSPNMEARNETIARMFDEAAIVQRALASTIAKPQGVAVEDAWSAIVSAQQAHVARSCVDGVILEATAAAACYLADDPAAHRLIVLDMGAGTTDIGCVVTGAGAEAGEIEAARRTLIMGGDFVDRVLLDLVVSRARHVKGAHKQSVLWRSLLTSIRESKEELFLSGRAAFPFEGKTVVVQRRDVEGDRDFKALIKSIRDAYQECLNAAAELTHRDGGNEILAVAVGGGARAPFIHDMLRKCTPSVRKVKVRPGTEVPAWAHDDAYGGLLAPVFPMAAIAMGASVAPSSLLSARTQR